MDRLWAVNASPLIVLGRIGLLPILSRLCSSLIIPTEVAAEVMRGNDDASSWLISLGRPFARDVLVDSRVLAWNLGVGESAVLSWCVEHRDYEALVDDRAARDCAETFGIRVRGTLSILVVAKSAGLIPAVTPKIEELRQLGFRMSEDVVSTILTLAQE
ncbi:MAG: DUF3368 domain-containing protein [Ignavibacteriae bacterium]|nr:DUF3368 domain-containing protein [Ignavibacteriota bacterium]